MTAHQVTGRPRRHLLLRVASWLPAAEEDNEHVGSSGLDRPLSWLAVATGVATFGFFAGTLVLRALIAGRGHDPADQVWSQALVGAAVAVPGTLIAARRPRHPIGWLLLLGGVWLAVPAFGAEYARYTFVAQPGSAGRLRAALPAVAVPHRVPAIAPVAAGGVADLRRGHRRQRGLRVPGRRHRPGRPRRRPSAVFRHSQPGRPVRRCPAGFAPDRPAAGRPVRARDRAGAGRRDRPVPPLPG